MPIDHRAFNLIAPGQRIEMRPASITVTDAIDAEPSDFRLPRDFDKVAPYEWLENFGFSLPPNVPPDEPTADTACRVALLEQLFVTARRMTPARPSYVRGPW